MLFFSGLFAIDNSFITQITTHLTRLQSVEKDLVALKASAPVKEDVTKVRAEMKKVYVSSPANPYFSYTLYHILCVASTE
jgi:hypothetical protein